MKTISVIILAGIIAFSIFTMGCQKTEQLSQQDVAAVNGMEEELELLEMYNDSLSAADSAHVPYYDSLVVHHDSMFWWHHSQYSHDNLHDDHHHDGNNHHHGMGENHNGHQHGGHGIDTLIDNPMHGEHHHNMHDEEHNLEQGEDHYHNIYHHDMIDSMAHHHARFHN